MATDQNFIVKNGLVVQGTANSTSTSTGALLVHGGAGIAGDLWVGGTIFLKDGAGMDNIVATTGTFVEVAITGTTVSVNTTTGALVVNGGVGVGGSLYATELYDSGARVITTATIGQNGVTKVVAGNGVSVSPASGTGVVTVTNTATLQYVTGLGASTTNAITINNATNAATTQSGALVVAGGAGFGADVRVGGDLYVGGTVFTNKGLSTTGTITTNLAGNRIVVSDSNGTLVTDADLTYNTVTNALSVGGVLSVTDGTASNSVTSGALTVAGGVGIGGQLTAQSAQIVSATAATIGGAGALKVNGGIFVGDNLIVTGTASSPSTTTSNALYVAGGAGIAGDLIVGGEVTFKRPVTFNGTATYVYSTNTYYTDNLIELHVPQGGTDTPWTMNDGKDIGLRYHYYDTSDKDAALILEQSTGFLEWYSQGSEDSNGNFVPQQFGTFRSGSIILTTTTNSTSANTGALQVAGGVGIGQDLYVSGKGTIASTVNATSTTTGALVVAGGVGVGGSLYATELYDSGSRVITEATIAANGVTQVVAGSGVSVSPSNGKGVVTVTNTATLQFVTNLGASTTNAITITNATNATTTQTGALVVSGGAGFGADVRVGGDLYVGGTVFTNKGLSTTGTITTNMGGNRVVVTDSNGALFTTSTFSFNTATGVLTLLTPTTSVSTMTGAMVIVGGLGVGADVQIGGNLTVGGTIFSKTGIQTSGTINTNLGGNRIVYTDNTGTLVSSANLTYSATGTVMIVSPTTSISTMTGALVVTGGAGFGADVQVGGNLTVGGTVFSRTGIQTSGTISTNLGGDRVVVTDNGGSLTSTALFGFTTSTGVLTLGSTLTSVSTMTGALVVTGGAGFGADVQIGGNLTVGGTIFSRTGIQTSGTISTNLGGNRVVYTDNTGTFASNAAFTFDGTSKVSINLATASTTTATGALTVLGGVGIGGNVTIGGTAIFNNSLISTYTSPTISTNAVQNLDTFAAASYRTVRYLAQIVDGTKVHVTEITLFHDGTNVYKNEYGISTNTGELGTFDATLSGGTVTLTFGATNPTSLVVKLMRTSLSA